MALHPSTTYKGSFYAKADAADLGPVTVRVVNDNTGSHRRHRPPSRPSPPTGSSTTSPSKPAHLIASANNHLELTVAHPGTAWFTLVSLFPPTYKNRPNGNRADLMEKLAAMHPAFLRFPGGNYLEGDHINERFDWKKTLGPLVDRPTHPSPWNYQSSDGMGLLEFLEWCEDLHMQPVLAVYAGYSLTRRPRRIPAQTSTPTSRTHSRRSSTSPAAPTPSGEPSAPKTATPRPSISHYVEIGNEDWFDQLRQLRRPLRPVLQSHQGEVPGSATHRHHARSRASRPTSVDDHYYRTAAAVLRRRPPLRHRPTATARRSSSASGPRAKALPPPTSAPRSATPHG